MKLIGTIEETISIGSPGTSQSTFCHNLSMKRLLYSQPNVSTGENVAEKNKTDIDLPFFKIKEDEEGTYVKVGPIEVVEKKGEEAKARVEPLRISESGVKYEPSLNSRLEGMAWATFFILIGCVWLFESMYDLNLRGFIAVGIGVILLSLNYVRSRVGIEMSSFTIVVGLIFIAYGILERFFEEVEFLPLIGIAVGIYLILAFGREARK